MVPGWRLWYHDSLLLLLLKLPGSIHSFMCAVFECVVFLATHSDAVSIGYEDPFLFT